MRQNQTWIFLDSWLWLTSNMSAADLAVYPEGARGSDLSFGSFSSCLDFKNIK